MRLTTRFAATLLTAGALLAPATIPSAHAIAPTAVVADLGTTFAPSLAPSPNVVKAGTQLAVINTRIDREIASYTLTWPNGTAETISNVKFADIVTFAIPGALVSAPNLNTMYTLTASPGGHSVQFVAL